MTPTPPGTESVWDYPRPPRLEPTPRRIRITHGAHLLADTTAALRILETSHPPVYYLPQSDLTMRLLRPSPRRGSFCEWKGTAQYWDVLLPSTPDGAPAQTLPAIAWSYPDPTRTYAALKDHLAFYCAPFQPPTGTCTVAGEQVTPQPGGFYGGWITADLTGPFKGAPGTLGW